MRDFRYILGWILFALLAIGAGWYLLIYRGGSAPAEYSLWGSASTSTEVGVVVFAGPRTAVAGAQEYRSTAYRFSLLYPENLEVKEFDEGGGAATVAFQNIETSQGFQIFITPYNELQVTPERFRLDAPSGVMQNPVDTAVGGVPARSFFGRDGFLGDTAELWFIYKGYLYEVTAPKEHTAWLSSIMGTWQFLE